jgi:DNA-binding transcriptional LysR family regulator
VVLRLSTGWSRDLAERVRSGALDAAVVLLPRGESLPSGVAGRELAAEQLQIVASRASRSRNPALKDVAAGGWILNPEGCAARATLQKAFAKAGLPLRVGVETYNYELQMSLVARGRGLGLVPGRLVSKSAARPKLAVLEVRGLEFPMTVWLLTAGLPAALEAALAAFADSLQRRLAPKRSSR